MRVTDEMTAAAYDHLCAAGVIEDAGTVGEDMKGMKAALEAALAISHAAGQEVVHAAKDAGIELSQRAVFVPCDCGCGRSCCAHCGVGVGFLPAVARSEGEG